MQDYKVLNDRGGIGWPTVHAIATSTITEHNNQMINAQELMLERAKDPYYRQASSTVELPGATFNYVRNRFLVPTVLIDGAVQTDFLTALQQRIL